MGFWVLLLINIGLWVIGDLIRPKPKVENAKPRGLGDFNFPTATEGRVVPIVWGRVRLDGPNVVWYGDLVNEPIKKKYKTGIFSSQTVITGYRYYIGLQFGICRGPGVRIHNVKVDEKYVCGPGDTGGYTGSYNIDKPDLFGGEEEQGGIIGNAKFYSGELSQSPNAYLSAKTGGTINYNGICYFVFEGGNIGQSESIQPWSFEISRICDGLNLAAHNPGAEVINTYECNPINVIYEIMTDAVWGLGINSGQIDQTNFREAAVTLASEANGFSMILDSEREASEVITEILKQVDGLMYFNRVAGKWQIALARYDYIPDNLVEFNESNIIELTDLTRTTWHETTNQVRVRFIDRDSNYKDTYALAQDMANMAMQETVVSTELNFPGVMNATTANRLAWRELAVMSYPLVKVNFTVNRKAFELTPGTTFKLSWVRLGIEEIIFRVATINYGTLDNGVISVYAVQDIFSAGQGVFSDPPGTGWIAPTSTAVAPDPDDTLVFEAPGQLAIQDTDFPYLNPRIWAGARYPGGGTNRFQMYSRTGLTRPISSDYEEDAGIYTFLKAGSLQASIPSYGSSATRPASDYYITINNNDPDDLSSFLVVGNSSLVLSLINLVVVGDEFIGFESMTDIGGGVYRLEKVYRGLLDSAPATHAAGTRVWFIGQSGGNLTKFSIPTSSSKVDLQLRSVDKYGTMSEGDTPVNAIDLTRVFSQPLPPRDPKLNGSYAPASSSIDVDYHTEIGMSGDNGKGISVSVTPRCWRINDLLNDTDLSSVPYLGDNPEFDFTITVNPTGASGTTPVATVNLTSTPITHIPRNLLIIAAGANNPLVDARVNVVARHYTMYGLQTAAKTMTYDFDLSSELQSMDEAIFGGLDRNVASSSVTFSTAGTYVFNIGSALPSSGIVEISVDGGSWSTLIGAGSSTGNWVNTGSHDVRLRYSQYPTGNRLFTISESSIPVGYGVLRGI